MHSNAELAAIKAKWDAQNGGSSLIDKLNSELGSFSKYFKATMIAQVRHVAVFGFQTCTLACSLVQSMCTVLYVQEKSI